MDKNMACLEGKFGDDHGLIHEAVATGRKVGADKKFWSALAHNQGLFADDSSVIQSIRNNQYKNKG